MLCPVRRRVHKNQAGAFAVVVSPAGEEGFGTESRVANVRFVC